MVFTRVCLLGSFYSLGLSSNVTSVDKSLPTTFPKEVPPLLSVIAPIVPHSTNQNHKVILQWFGFGGSSLVRLLINYLSFPLDAQLHEGRAPVCLVHCYNFRSCYGTQETRV